MKKTFSDYHSPELAESHNYFSSLYIIASTIWLLFSSRSFIVYRFVDNDSLFVRRKSAMSRLKHQQQQQATTVAEVPVVKTQGRRVTNSLQRLEREQDEIFQL
jgi:uncharacterized protein YgbK (DUF1537 family)